MFLGHIVVRHLFDENSVTYISTYLNRFTTSVTYKLESACQWATMDLTQQINWQINALKEYIVYIVTASVCSTLEVLKCFFNKFDYSATSAVNYL